MLFSFGLGLRYQASADLNGISTLHFFPHLPSEAWAPASPALVKSSSPHESKVQQDTERKGKQLFPGDINEKCERIWGRPEGGPWQSNPDSTHCPQGCPWSWCLEGWDGKEGFPEEGFPNNMPSMLLHENQE